MLNCLYSISLTYRGTPYQVTTPTCPMSPAIQSSEISNCSSVELTHAWLSKNRFGQFVSLFANYTGQDLLRLSRRDLVELCGAPDGIRLYNALRATTVRVVYITMGTEKGGSPCLDRTEPTHTHTHTHTHSHTLSHTHTQSVTLFAWRV